ncbi:MAG: Spo0E family sporulation regulatory protein-aspartic acid phosphatase [Planifilum sp.]|jgi:hypothetical protein
MDKGLGRQFEEVRRELEEVAVRLGLDHPEVYRLSRRLDRLHNQMLRERKALMKVPCRRRDRIYRIRRYSYYLREEPEGCGYCCG